MTNIEFFNSKLASRRSFSTHS